MANLTNITLLGALYLLVGPLGIELGIILRLVAAVLLIAASIVFTEGGASSLLKNKNARVDAAQVAAHYDTYEKLYGGQSRSAEDKSHAKLEETRKELYKDVVNHYYNLSTDFYEYGWGDSFHFARRRLNETFGESLKRSEHYLALRLGLKKGMKVMDIGCGVGGPARTIASFSGAHVTGVNINDYQLSRAAEHTVKAGLTEQTAFVKADFMNLPFPRESFHAAYTIEATCHAPDRVKVFRSIFESLKPGGQFAGYEWVMTDKYDEKDPVHLAIKQGIEIGNGLPTITDGKVVVDALKEAGFEVIEAVDHQTVVHDAGQICWYAPLVGGLSLEGFRRSQFGRSCTTAFCVALEALKIAPKGTVKVSKMLNFAADDLVAAGRLEIFTPTYFFLARKPQ